jgi:hypothetical protein
VQLLERVLYHVLRGAKIADDQQGQPDQFQMTLTEQLGDIRRPLGAHRVDRRARAANHIVLHAYETRTPPRPLRRRGPDPAA